MKMLLKQISASKNALVDISMGMRIIRASADFITDIATKTFENKKQYMVAK